MKTFIAIKSVSGINDIGNEYTEDSIPSWTRGWHVERYWQEYYYKCPGKYYKLKNSTYLIY